MKDLLTSPQNLGLQTRKSEIAVILLTAFERTGTEPKGVDNMVNDVVEEFKKTKLEDIKKAIRNGGLGMYGVSFKMTTQQVCFWIREYKRNQKGIQL